LRIGCHAGNGHQVSPGVQPCPNELAKTGHGGILASIRRIISKTTLLAKAAAEAESAPPPGERAGRAEGRSPAGPPRLAAADDEEGLELTEVETRGDVIPAPPSPAGRPGLPGGRPAGAWSAPSRRPPPSAFGALSATIAMPEGGAGRRGPRAARPAAVAGQQPAGHRQTAVEANAGIATAASADATPSPREGEQF
jgi:hypothetical protein